MHKKDPLTRFAEKKTEKNSSVNSVLLVSYLIRV